MLIVCDILRLAFFIQVFITKMNCSSLIFNAV